MTIYGYDIRDVEDPMEKTKLPQFILAVSIATQSNSRCRVLLLLLRTSHSTRLQYTVDNNVESKSATETVGETPPRSRSSRCDDLSGDDIWTDSIPTVSAGLQ